MYNKIKDEDDHFNVSDIFNSFRKFAPLLKTCTFQTILNQSSGYHNLATLEAVITLLIKEGIGFNVDYSGGSSRNAPSAQLQIFITPTLYLTIIFYFAPGDR
ncbi:MAG: hypothetical protein CVU87_08240 [Firmicutes bacterium HGW-Firmicutes-12]|jgi:hypothetical protein|nr:MAG: hypothetical protein CVU87_08240 [Firmicutes bacterium HGW-Firmicutes-12]